MILSQESDYWTKVRRASSTPSRGALTAALAVHIRRQPNQQGARAVRQHIRRECVRCVVGREPEGHIFRGAAAYRPHGGWNCLVRDFKLPTAFLEIELVGSSNKQSTRCAFTHFQYKLSNRRTPATAAPRTIGSPRIHFSPTPNLFHQIPQHHGWLR